MNSLTINYDALSSLTQTKMLPILVDNIFSSNPLTLKLLKNAEMLDGGTKIVTPLEYGKNSAQGFYSGYDVLSTTPSDPITTAVWDWKQGYSTITISGEEELKNAGESQVLSLLKSKMRNAEKSLKDLFGEKMFNTGVVGANDITSLAYDATNKANHVMNVDRSLGGLDSTTYTWWDAGNVSAFTDPSSDGSLVTWTEHVTVASNEGTSYIVKDMTKAYGSVTIGNDQPDLIITTQVLYDAYEASLQSNKRFEGDAELANYGFNTIKFKNATVVADSHCPDGHMYFLNTKYLDFKVHNKRNFAFEGFQKPVNQDAQVAKIFWMGQLVCSNPRMQGVLHTGAIAY